MAFLHSVLAQTFLPYRDPKTRDYMRENGRASMVLTAGYLLDPTTRKPVLQGLPYGTKPRLLLVHLCTQAIRLQTPVIPIADSMSAFMRELGLKVTGGKHGTVGRFQDQLHRLAAARVQLMFDAGDFGTTLDPDPLIRRFDAWFPDDPRARALLNLAGERGVEALAEVGDPHLPVLRLVLIPVIPSAADLVATTAALELVQRAMEARRDGGPRYMLVPSRVDRRTSAGREIEAALKKFGARVAPSIGQRAAFVDAFGAGEWIGDYAPKSKAATEMEALAKAVRRLLI